MHTLNFFLNFFLYAILVFLASCGFCFCYHTAYYKYGTQGLGDLADTNPHPGAMSQCSQVPSDRERASSDPRTRISKHVGQVPVLQITHASLINSTHSEGTTVTTDTWDMAAMLFVKTSLAVFQQKAFICVAIRKNVYSPFILFYLCSLLHPSPPNLFWY